MVFAFPYTVMMPLFAEDLLQLGSEGLGILLSVAAAVLARHLPERYQRLQYFICGSDSMMDAAEDALVHLRVPKRRVHTERFGMV